jgi:hypothetical protein
VSWTTDVRKIAAAIAAIAAQGCAFELHEVVADAGVDAGATSPCNLVRNPSFEDNTSFWTGSGSTLSQAPIDDAVEGCCAARVSRDPGDSTSFAIRDEPPTVSVGVAGGQYRATAWVRSGIDPPNPAATVRLHLREGDNLDQVATTEELPLTGTFQKLSLTGIATLDGDLIDVHLTQYQAVEGDAFLVDAIELVHDGDPACP